MNVILTLLSGREESRVPLALNTRGDVLSIIPLPSTPATSSQRKVRQAWGTLTIAQQYKLLRGAETFRSKLSIAAYKNGTHGICFIVLYVAAGRLLNQDAGHLTKGGKRACGARGGRMWLAYLDKR